MTYSGLGYAPEGFEPIGTGPMAGRQWLAAQVRALDYFGAWEVYAEPPEQLVSGPCVVIAPRDPYWSWGTYREVQCHLTLTLLVPRGRGPSMDVLDPALAQVFALLQGMDDADIGSARVGLIDETGGADYIAALVDVDLTGGTL